MFGAHSCYGRYELSGGAGEAAVVKSLFHIARSNGARSIRMLDYGAGSASYSLRASVLGASRIVAYDRSYPANYAEAARGLSALPIAWAAEREELAGLGPFEAAICVNVIEHTLDPRLELQTIYDVLAPGGLLYINNPWMDLEFHLPELRQARKIGKQDYISCYHPKHYNYLSAAEFETMSRAIGYRITPYVIHKDIPPFGPGLWGAFFKAVASLGVRFGQNALTRHKKRQGYVLEKRPAS